MTNEERLEELRKTAIGLRKAQDEAVEEAFNKGMLDIVKPLSTYDFKVRSIGTICCRLTFVKCWHFDISINLYKDMVFLSHGLYGNDEATREYVIEADKLIAKLWDKQDELVVVFKKAKQVENKYFDALCEIERKIWEIEDKIKKEQRETALKELVVGSKWYWAFSKDRPFTIEKITDKLIFIKRSYNSWGDNKERFKIDELVNDYLGNRLVKVEE